MTLTRTARRRPCAPPTTASTGRAKSMSTEYTQCLIYETIVHNGGLSGELAAPVDPLDQAFSRHEFGGSGFELSRSTFGLGGPESTPRSRRGDFLSGLCHAALRGNVADGNDDATCRWDRRSACSPRPPIWPGRTTPRPGFQSRMDRVVHGRRLDRRRSRVVGHGNDLHYDVVHADLSELVARMVGSAHRVLANPHHDPGGER